MSEPRPTEGGAATLGDGRRIAAGIVLFLLLFGLASAFVFAMPGIYDTDSYCHMGIALLYAEQGILHDLPAARFSAMSDGFGDKDFLFHLLLSRFVHEGSSAGGRLALALFIASILTVVSLLAAGAIGRWGLLAGPALWLLAHDVPDRLLRLRPELAGLLLLLVATAAAARGRHRLLGVLCLVIVLTYNVAQLLVVLVAGWAFVRWWRGNRFHWAGILYPVAGVGLGLVAHPHFPKNLEIWYLITFEHFGRVGEFSEGGLELLPARASDIFRANQGWWIALVLLAASLVRREARADDRLPEGHEAGCYTIAALAFAALYFGPMWRFGLQFYPFATLAFLYEAQQRGFEIGRWTPSAGRLRVPTWLALSVAGALAFVSARAMAAYFLDRRAPGPPREVEWKAFGEAVPAGAKVAAPWGDAGAYLFWAPSARFLNLLDPLYMADAYPQTYAAQKKLFAGELADVALVVGDWLDSDYLAFSRFLAAPRFQSRLVSDPRLELVYSGYNLLYRVLPDANGSFWLDWSYSVVDRQRTNAFDEVQPYPRAPGASAGLEGFVDGDRIGAEDRCARFVRSFELADAVRLELELAPYGPALLTIDGVARADVRASTGAVLGRGAVVVAELERGVHQVEVETCRAESRGQHGFFLRELSRR